MLLLQNLVRAPDIVLPSYGVEGCVNAFPWHFLGWEILRIPQTTGPLQS